MIYEWINMAVVAVLACLQQYGIGLAQAATGCGKTTLASEVAKLLSSRPEKVLAIAPSTAIVAELKGKGFTSVTIHSLLKKQGHTLEAFIRSFEMVVFDECHHYPESSNPWGSKAQEIIAIARYYQIPVLALSATPRRQDELSVYNVFGQPSFMYSMMEGIRDGILTPLRGYTLCSSVSIDLTRKGYPTTAAYMKAKYAKAMDEFISLVLNSGKRAVVFCEQQEDCFWFADRFHAACQGRFHCCNTAEDKRAAAAFKEGIGQVIVTCKALNEGWSCNDIEMIGIFRPVFNYLEFLQIVGRGTRRAPGKTECGIYSPQWRANNWKNWDKVNSNYSAASVEALIQQKL